MQHLHGTLPLGVGTFAELVEVGVPFVEIIFLDEILVEVIIVVAELVVFVEVELVFGSPPPPPRSSFFHASLISCC